MQYCCVSHLLVCIMQVTILGSVLYRIFAFLQVARVHYPGLQSHPEHDIAAKQMKCGFGGVVSFEVRGSSSL